MLLHAPRHDFDVHRPLDADDNLNQIFTWREPRKVSKSLTVRYAKMLLLLEDNDDSRRAMGKYLDAWQYPDGRLELRRHSAMLPYIASTYIPLINFYFLSMKTCVTDLDNLYSLSA